MEAYLGWMEASNLMSLWPTISVITATFNSASDLPRLLSSLRLQTDRDFSHVIVDGGSTDGTWEIIESHKDIVTHTIREPDNGIYDALNKGIRHSDSEFYLFMGADDLLYPNTIADFKAAVRSTNADVLIAAVMAANKIRRGFRRNRGWLGHPAMITSHSVGMLIKKRLHEEFGYYSTSYPTLADGYFIKRICKIAAVQIIPVEFVAGEFGTHGVSNNNLARVLCEFWQVQLDTGENPLVQYLLFQLRLIKNLGRIIRRPTTGKTARVPPP